MLFRSTEKDTNGYGIDFLNRFSEEVGIPYRLIVCKSQIDVQKKFKQGIGNLYLLNMLHDSIESSTNITQSLSIVQRNLSANAYNLLRTAKDSYTQLSTLNGFLSKMLVKSLQANSGSRMIVQSKFQVAVRDSLVLKSLNDYIKNVEHRADISYLKNYYFGITLPINMRKYLIPSFKNGNISPFDKLFKTAAEKYNWDWKLLAAISFKESRFNPNALGGGGAFGLMQFMPSIGTKYGVSPTSTPQQQINAGMRLLNAAYMSWRNIPNQEQRIKFTLASYNAGKAHIDDAQRLAAKHGLNPLVWDNNVQLMVNNLSLSKYYTDEVVQFGAYHGQADIYANLVYQIYLSWKLQ